MDTTTIRVRQETRNILRELQSHPRETADGVIARLIVFYNQNKSEEPNNAI